VISSGKKSFSHFEQRIKEHGEGEIRT